MKKKCPKCGLKTLTSNPEFDPTLPYPQPYQYDTLSGNKLFCSSFLGVENLVDHIKTKLSNYAPVSCT